MSDSFLKGILFIIVMSSLVGGFWTWLLPQPALFIACIISGFGVGVVAAKVFPLN